MDTPSPPAVSVLMPVHDAGRFLAPAIESVLAQTLADFELIAIDDGSRDASGQLLDAFAARDRRLRVVHQDNAGIVASLNRALALARAPLVARMDADDVARPDRLAKQVAFLAAHPEIAVVSGAMDIIDADGRSLRSDVFPTQPDVIARELLQRNCICHPAVMARTAVLRSVGGYRRSAQYAEDYDLWLRIAEIGQIANLPDVLMAYRLHPVTISAQHHVAQELAALAVRGAARLRRSHRPDPLEGIDPCDPAGYRAVQQSVADVVPRAEFAVSFFRAVIGRSAETGSIGVWAKLYLQYGLWDVDRDGAAMMLLVLGHTMLRSYRMGAPLHALAAYPFWALITAVCHPVAAWSVMRDARKWSRQIGTGTEADVRRT